MSRKFTKKSIASVPLDGGEVEFNNDDFPISFSTEQERSMYSAVSVNRLASQSYELWVDPDGKQEKIRYGRPISINTQTYWSVLLFARSYGGSEETISISKMIDMSIKNIVLTNFVSSDEDVEQLNMYSQTSNFKRLSSGIRKFVYIEDEDEFKEFFVPDITYHPDEFLRLLLLSIVSPELLADDEMTNVSAFFLSGDIKGAIGISMPPEEFREEIMKTKIPFQELHKRTRAFITSKEYEEYLINLGPSANKIPEYRNFIRRVSLFGQMTEASLANFEKYFYSVRWLSERFGIIKYK